MRLFGAFGYLRNSKYPLDGFSPSKDVTDWYMSTSIRMSLFRTDLSDDYLYIAAFNTVGIRLMSVVATGGKGVFRKWAAETPIWFSAMMGAGWFGFPSFTMMSAEAFAGMPIPHAESVSV